MRRQGGLLWHETRLMFTWAFPVALLLATAILLLVFREIRLGLEDMARVVSPGAARQLAEAWAIRVAEIVLPPVAIVAAGQATTLDHEPGTAELVRSLAPWRPSVPLRRLAVGWAGFLLAVPAVLAGSRVTVAPGYDLLAPAGAPLAPAAFLTGLVLLTATLLRSYPAGLAAGLVVWFSDFVRPGDLTGVFYLFQRGNPLETLDLLTNRLSLAVAGGTLTALAVWLQGRRG